MIDFLVRCLPSRLVRKVGWRLLRASSPDCRAHTELFTPPYDHWVPWNSGLGDAVQILYALVRALRPHVVVEIGSARGKSTCAMSLACKQNRSGKVFAIDPHGPTEWNDVGGASETFDFLSRRLRDYRLTEWCELIRATSAAAADAWDRPIDFLFIDGDHSFDGVKFDFEAFRPWLTDRSLVAFHDTTWEYHRDHPWYHEGMGVPAYLQRLQDAGYQSITLPAVPGLTLLYPRIGGFPFLPSPKWTSAARRS
jgi:predicted O-methyltransferase YrrM